MAWQFKAPSRTLSAVYAVIRESSRECQSIVGGLHHRLCTRSANIKAGIEAYFGRHLANITTAQSPDTAATHTSPQLRSRRFERSTLEILIMTLGSSAWGVTVLNIVEDVEKNELMRTLTDRSEVQNDSMIYQIAQLEW